MESSVHQCAQYDITQHAKMSVNRTRVFIPSFSLTLARPHRHKCHVVGGRAKLPSDLLPVTAHRTNAVSDSQDPAEARECAEKAK